VLVLVVVDTMVVVVDDTDPVAGSPCLSVRDAELVPEHDDVDEADEAEDGDENLLLLMVGYVDDVVDKDDERLAEIRLPTSKCSEVKSQHVEISSGESLVLGLNVATPLSEDSEES